MEMFLYIITKTKIKYDKQILKIDMKDPTR